MSLVGLHKAFKARLEAVAAQFPLLETKSGGARAPIVFDGWTPPKPKSGDAADQYPFLLLRHRGGKDSWQGAEQNGEANLDVVIGVYSDDDDGWLDLVLLIDAIRFDLGGAPSIQGTAYEQTGPLSWDVPEEQPRPQWLGKVSTTWTVPRPTRLEARNPRNEIDEPTED